MEHQGSARSVLSTTDRHRLEVCHRNARRRSRLVPVRRHSPSLSPGSILRLRHGISKGPARPGKRIRPDPRPSPAIARMPARTTHLVSEVSSEPRRRPGPCWDERAAAARSGACRFCLLVGEELRPWNWAFSLEISSRSAAISFCTPMVPSSEVLAGSGVGGKGAATGIHGRKRLAADDAAAEVK
jgi:hypothetical protein